MKRGRKSLYKCSTSYDQDGHHANYMSLVMRISDFCICENKDADQLRGDRFAVTPKLISAFIFATWIVQSLFCLNPNAQVSSHLLWLYSLVCVRPGRKPRRPVFFQRGSYTIVKNCPIFSRTRSLMILKLGLEQ